MLRSFSFLAPLALCAILTGCGIGNLSTTTTTTAMSVISGKVHGGQQPIAGAQVYLYAANSSAYGGAPTSLLNSPGYVTTDADGNFSFNGAYSLSACQAAHQLVYIVAVGGNPGAGSVNPNAVLMAALGDCANLSATSFVYLNEVTTVASVYALQQFMSPGTYNVGTSSGNLVGLQNAFLTVSNLVNLATGNAYLQLPAMATGLSRSGPQTQVNSLANILAACVNSASPFTACTSLFAAATPSGGTAPTDTLGAILDVALHPGNNVATLYKLPPPVAAFAPALTTQPNDWTLGLLYQNIGVYSSTYGTYVGGIGPLTNIAVDSAGNLWGAPNIAYSQGIPQGIQGPVEWSPAGVNQPQDASMTSLAYTGVNIAITPSGLIWVGASYELNAAGVLIDRVGSACSGQTYSTATDASGTLFAPGNQLCSITEAGVVTTSPAVIGPYPLAFDAAGHLWAPSGLGAAVEVNKDGSLVASEPASGWPVGPTYLEQSSYTGIAIDHEGDAWMRYSYFSSGVTTNSLVEVSPTGGVLIGPGTINLPDTGGNSLAIDGSDTVWVPNRAGSILHFDHGGALISPATGYWNSEAGLQSQIASGGSLQPTSIAIDGSGNVWMPSISFNGLTEMVGVAAPVATPLSLNLVNNSIGQRP